MHQTGGSRDREPGRAASRRVAELDYVTTIGMLLIVFGHAFIARDYQSSNPGWYITAQSIVYGFHIHLFFFVSGLLLIHSNAGKRFRYGPFLGKRSQRLLVPYLFFTLINVIPAVLFPELVYQPVESPADVLYLLVHPKINTIRYHWFVVVLFAVSMFAPIFLRAGRHFVASTVVTVALLAAVLFIPKRSFELLALSAWPHYGFYFWLGCLFAYSRNGWLRQKILDRPATVFAVCASLGTLLYVSVLAPGHPRGLTTHLGQVGLAISGIGAVYSLGVLCQRHSLRAAAFLAGTTYSVYLLSWYGHKLAEVVLNRTFDLGFGFVFPASVFLAIALPLGAVRVLGGRFRFLDLILGVQGPRAARVRGEP